MTLIRKFEILRNVHTKHYHIA